MDFAAAFTRDPQAATHPVRRDATAAAALAVLAAVIALTVDDGRRLDALGWALLLATYVSLAWRRKAPMPVLLAMAACVAPYHGLDYMHLAPLPATMTALYTVAATGRAKRTVIVGLSVTSLTLTMQLFVNPHEMVEVLRVSGWVIAMLVFALVARGLNNTEIAEALGLSPLTAKTHVSRIMGKLSARDRAQLVIVAYESGLVAPGR
ncbi:LuxR C-terminal-related transcriptional regulator [Streptomyces sp. P9(2023)]|uniref:response regulator transcription factor n=1 Tax=Streptomyces sp. P9(2023) TaxID=3064394 RepID=UPI0028F426A3|nr:LuxR C-terminal-related transcriptional regulator [Streptomyces sp. P9(2023)]MDT9690708.1 LuxR C-terminal-related transcriptional regulator [Streptomyces sp. P9(2023)]